MKRYTTSFQKLQLLMVYSSLSTLLGVSSVVTGAQAWVTGDGWPVLVVFLLMTAVPVYSAFSTFRQLSIGLNVDGNGATAPDNQVHS